VWCFQRYFHKTSILVLNNVEEITSDTVYVSPPEAIITVPVTILPTGDTIDNTLYAKIAVTALIGYYYYHLY
jgi:hypothetical protein